MKNLVKKLILFLLWSYISVSNAHADDVFEWMDSSFSGLANLFSTCIERPKVSGMETNQRNLSMEDSGEWVSTGIYVQGDRLLQFQWNTKAVIKNPKTHMVLYRVDPRFERPQIFIQTFDQDEDKYISDFHEYLDGQLLRYQLREEIDFENRKSDFTDYFNFVGRNEIQVEKDDQASRLYYKINYSPLE